MSLLNKMKSQSVLGVFSKTTDSSFVEATGIAGLDFIILDCEHGSITSETLCNHIRAAKITNISSIVRVKNIDAHSIGAALDTGATGVQVPNINTADQAKKAVEAARFYPLGKRGVCRFVRAASFGTEDKSKYFFKANQSILILQVEGLEGVNNIDAILEVPNFDVLFIGPYDLSQSVGKPGEVNSVEVLDLMRSIAQKAKAKNVILGTFCDTLENAKIMKEEGFTYIAYSVDVNIYIQALSKLIGEV